MKRGGQTIYCGPLGSQSSDLVAYFQVGCMFLRYMLADPNRWFSHRDALPTPNLSLVHCRPYQECLLLSGRRLTSWGGWSLLP